MGASLALFKPALTILRNLLSPATVIIQHILYWRVAMNIDLTGKTAIVTGSTKGIGRGIAESLGRCGAQLVITGRSSASVDEACAALRHQQPNVICQGLAVDLGTAAGCEQLIEHVPDCDILVNNLGIFGPQDFFETPDSVWQQFFEVNVLAGVRLSRHYLPAMQARGWGRVVFLSSESALNIPADMIHYGFTKTAVLSVARGLAKRMAGTGVTVNSVLPGPTLSDGVADMLSDQVDDQTTLESAAADFVMEHRPSSIIQRAATVEEVANMVTYICSTQASATTGAALRVDGGVVDSI